MKLKLKAFLKEKNIHYKEIKQNVKETEHE